VAVFGRASKPEDRVLSKTYACRRFHFGQKR